jgi:hypothetical protein
VEEVPEEIIYTKLDDEIKVFAREKLEKYES